MDVTLPDGTTVTGVPDGTSRQQLAEKLRAGGRDVPKAWLSAPPQAAKPEVGLGRLTDHPAVGAAEGAASLLSGAAAKPVSDIAGLAATAKEAISPSPGGGDPEGFQRSVREGLTYEPRTNAGKLAAKYNPLTIGAQIWGKGAHAVRNLVAPEKTSGPARSAVGNAVEEGINQAPALLGAKAPAGAEAAAGAMKGGARELMQSALKPSKAELQSGKAASAVDTLLEQGVNVTPGGVRTLRERIEKLDEQIATVIESSPAKIDKQAVAAYTKDTFAKFQKQVAPMNDVAAIQRVWDEFIETYPDKIPIKEAQEVKRGTYRALGDKSYGELKGAEIEAQKALARGLKEEIVKAAPDVRPLNAEQSKLINALSIAERRVLMSANKNPMGLGWLTTSPGKWAGFMADRSELFKSLVARMLNSAGEVAPVGAASVAPAVGAVVPSQADRNKPISQMPAQLRQQPIRDIGQ